MPPNIEFQDFINPYQSFVTDEINRQAEIRRNELAQNAVRGGAFGGGREGVQLAEFGAASDRNRAVYKQVYYNKVLIKQLQEEVNLLEIK